MKPKVLIIDDSLTVRMDLAEAFEAAELEPVLCGTVAEARAALGRWTFAVIVLDVILPDGDGVELLEQLRRDPSTSTVPILMLSAEAEVKDRIRGLATGADDYVGKPYDRGYVIGRAHALMRARAQSSAQGAPARTTVLLVDDSETFRQELGAHLDRAGFTVLFARDGAEGLRVARDRRPSAIIADSVMPEMDGVTMIRTIRLDAALRDTPCVLLTASEDGGVELRALDAGADTFVRKEEDAAMILARISATLRSAQAPRVDLGEPGGPKRILAVDDSPTYLAELASILRDEGYGVVLARSGEEAIAMLAIQSFDCILLDQIMPGLGGRETCRRIKSSPVVRDIPLIIVTGLEDREAMIDGLGLGADDYISKSSERPVLEARVRAQIRRKQLEDEHRRVREQLLRRELEATEARAAKVLAETRAALIEQLERKNQELEAFSYSVSHDLRAPLRTIDGFSRTLLEDYEGQLDEKAEHRLKRIRAASQRMGELIDDLLHLSRVGRADLNRRRVDLSEIAHRVIDELGRRAPERTVEVHIDSGLVVDADEGLMQVLLENLLGNAWKFTGKAPAARIELSSESTGERRVYFVRDNGAGFSMEYAEKLFKPFQRLHREADFPGTGIGLATVYRIVDRHGGSVWAEGTANAGAKFSFTIPPVQR